MFRFLCNGRFINSIDSCCESIVFEYSLVSGATRSMYISLVAENKHQIRNYHILTRSLFRSEPPRRSDCHSRWCIPRIVGIRGSSNLRQCHSQPKIGFRLETTVELELWKKSYPFTKRISRDFWNQTYHGCWSDTCSKVGPERMSNANRESSERSTEAIYWVEFPSYSGLMVMPKIAVIDKTDTADNPLDCQRR